MDDFRRSLGLANNSNSTFKYQGTPMSLIQPDQDLGATSITSPQIFECNSCGYICCCNRMEQSVLLHDFHAQFTPTDQAGYNIPSGNNQRIARSGSSPGVGYNAATGRDFVNGYGDNSQELGVYERTRNGDVSFLKVSRNQPCQIFDHSPIQIYSQEYFNPLSNIPTGYSPLLNSATLPPPSYNIPVPLLHIPASKPHACPKCGKAFNRKGDMRRHAQGHESPSFWCVVDTCKFKYKGFCRKDKWVDHLKTHGIVI